MQCGQNNYISLKVWFTGQVNMPQWRQLNVCHSRRPVLTCVCTSSDVAGPRMRGTKLNFLGSSGPRLLLHGISNGSLCLSASWGERAVLLPLLPLGGKQNKQMSYMSIPLYSMKMLDYVDFYPQQKPHLMIQLISNHHPDMRSLLVKTISDFIIIIIVLLWWKLT